MSDFPHSFVARLSARRIQRVSLSDSYHLALEAANIQSSDVALLRLQAVTDGLLHIIEKDGADQERQNLEPAYHNRQHVADAVLSMGYFLGRLPNLSANEKQVLLLAILVHDFGHRGIAKKLPGISHEDESIMLLKGTSIKGLSSKDILFIEECILATKPENIVRVNQEYLANPQDSVALMRALVNDADIAASFIDPIGLELSRLISVEQGVTESTEEEIAVALHNFRSRAMISTSVAREALGLPI